MKIYNYHPSTKEFTGTGIADKSPLDEEEVYLIPANATSVEPPEQVEGKALVFDNGEWKSVDVEAIAMTDVSNSSPATETAYKKMVSEMFDMAKEVSNLKSEMQSVKHDITLKDEKINKLEQEILKVNDKKQEV